MSWLQKKLDIRFQISTNTIEVYTLAFIKKQTKEAIEKCSLFQK